MLKQILPLLFTIIFSINLFAQSQDINKEITDIKLQIQEIKLLDARDEREKKIENLEEDIKKLEEKFNKGDIDKKEIDGKIATQDKLISEIGSNTNRVSWIISLFGVLITVIIIFFALKFGKNIDQEIQNIKREAEEQIKKWINEKADNEFKPKVDNYLKQIDEKSNELLNKIKNKSENLHQETKDLNKKYRKEIDLLQNNKYTEEEKDNLSEEVKKIRENKKEEDYTFSDRYKLFLFRYTKNEFEEALFILEKIFTLKLDDKNLVKVLFAKGVTLGELGKSEEAIEVYDELIERFKDSKENNILEKVAKALYNKGVSLGQVGKSEEEMKVYDELIERFKDSKENNILEQVAKALYNKGVTLGQVGKSEEEMKVYDELIERFKDLKDNNILEQVAKAFVNKGVTLGQVGKSEKAIEVYDELIERFKDSKENNILEKVAKALYNKGVILGELGKLEEAIEVYDELIERFKDSKENNILEKVAKAFVNKIETNIILGNISSKEDLDLYFNLIKENKEQLLKFEMLQIFEKAKNSNQDEKIKEWQIKFKDTKLHNWSFNELKTWAGTLENDAKERILRYIDIFENHNKNIEEK